MSIRVRGGSPSLRLPIDVDARQLFYTRLQTLPFPAMQIAGNFRNLRIAAGWEQATFTGRNFYDEDVYKWLEALAWELGRAPDPELQRMADETITLIAAAQEPDGYLDSDHQVAEPDQKWADLDHGHELYCAGHLVQAAFAFHRAVTADRLLAVALRLADHIDERFGTGKRDGTCGHPELETALVEIYRRHTVPARTAGRGCGSCRGGAIGRSGV